MKKNRWGTAALSAAVLVLASSLSVPASDIQIIIQESETEAPFVVELSQGQAQSGSASVDETEAESVSTRPLDPQAEGISASDAVNGARTLFSQMQHYADVNDNTNFASLFEAGADAQTIQAQLQQIKSSLVEMSGLKMHADFCYYDPTQGTTQSPYYFAVALCDYDVDQDGACAWFSTLMRVAKYEDGWKVSVMPAGELLEDVYPQAFKDAKNAGRNSESLYPSFALPFKDNAVFSGALYALPVLVWQEDNGDVSCAVWIANGTDGSKWCESIDLVASDEKLGDVMSVTVPVQMSAEAGASQIVTCTVPAQYVSTGTQAWTGISMNSDLKYQ